MQRVADVPSEFAENPTWEVPEQVFAEEGKYSVSLKTFMMSTFKRTARMRVGGRGYGRPNRIRLPTPTPPSPPPQEWVDLTESEEEDPEELVPELSEDEPGEEPQEEPLEVQPPVPSSAPPQEQP
ncbi:hypothetical protein U9M48_023660 [Paspalum notatum var. saurae]|uniref:Uncharacterized protein n=1 Tax=Paspalum notatum var. saurae TaxID=547442 RepID=A0AAQ3TKU6_PASNO